MRRFTYIVEVEAEDGEGPITLGIYDSYGDVLLNLSSYFKRLLSLPCWDLGRVHAYVFVADRVRVAPRKVVHLRPYTNPSDIREESTVELPDGSLKYRDLEELHERYS